MNNNVNSSIPDKTPITYAADTLAKKVRDAVNNDEALGLLL